MTEAEWLACDDPYPLLLHFYRGGAPGEMDQNLLAGGRDKFRLLICACCRRVWHMLTDPRSRAAVVVAEQFADGLVGEEELLAAHHVAEEAFDEVRSGRVAGSSSAAGGAAAAAGDLLFIGDSLDWFKFADEGSHADQSAEAAVRTRLVRDIYGNPFRPVAFDPAWRTISAAGLARLMYDSRDFSAMPILADALQDAGCENGDIFDHCRGPGPHVRGCWVVDLVLGKE